MKYINLIISFGLLSALASTSHAQPSFMRKGLSGIASPFATLGAISVAGVVGDKILNNVGVSRSVSPWFAGAAAAYIGYHLFVPTTQVFYALFSGDDKGLSMLVGKTEKDKGIIQNNEESIKEILREILYVKNKIVEIDGHRHTDEHGRYIVLDVLQKDLFTHDIAKIIDDKVLCNPLSANEQLIVNVLKKTKLLIAKKDTSNSHWWSTAIGKAILTTKNVITSSLAGTTNLYNRMAWNFKKDPRLLATLGGSAIEQAAEQLVESVKTIAEYNGAFPNKNELLRVLHAFYNNAEIIIRSAEAVLAQLKVQRESVQRVRDIVSFFNSMTAHDEHIDEYDELSMNILSHIYA